MPTIEIGVRRSFNQHQTPTSETQKASARLERDEKDEDRFKISPV
jgi:hypothetical protein